MSRSYRKPYITYCSSKGNSFMKRLFHRSYRHAVKRMIKSEREISNIKEYYNIWKLPSDGKPQEISRFRWKHYNSFEKRNDLLKIINRYSRK